MEKHHHRHPQELVDFFNVFSENQPLNEENYYITYNKALQKSPPSSSTPNLTVSTVLSLPSSSSFSSVVPSFNKTRTPKHTHQYFCPTTRKTKQSKPLNSNNISSGCSTTLKLYDDPWKIKKFLTASDVGKLNRLLLSSEDSVEDVVGALLLRNNNNNSNNDNDEEVFIMGREVRVYDIQTKSMHQLILKRWASFKNFVLIGDWNKDFVKRRSLNQADEIGLQWDPYNLCFNFSVLKRSIQ